MKTSSLRWGLCLGLPALMLLGWVSNHRETLAQIPKAKPPAVKPKPLTSGEMKSLESRVEKLQDEFIRDTQGLAKELEQAGLAGKAKTLYEALLKLDPKLPGLKEKVDELNDAALSANEFDVDLDSSRGWSQPVAILQKDQTARIRVEGEYKFSATLNVGADGLPTDDVANEVVAGLPVGAVIGVYISDKNKPGKPFLIGSKIDLKSNQNVALLLKVNAPAGHKSTGKLKVRISGAATKP